MSVLIPYDLIRDVPLKKFSVHDNVVFVWRGDDNGCTINGYLDKKLIWSRTLPKPFLTMMHFRDSILLSDPNESIQKITIATGVTTTEIVGDFIPVAYSGNNIVLSANFDGQYCTGLYNEDLNVLWQSNDYFDFYMSSGIEPLVGFPEEKNPNWEFNFLSCYDVVSGKVRWSVDLSTEPKFSVDGRRPQSITIQKFLGSINGQLWIALNNQKILIIDANTGERKSILGGPFFGYPPSLPNVFPSSLTMAIDDDSNQIIGLFMDNYWIIKPSSYEVTHFSLKEHFRNENVRCGGDFVFDEECIYFSDVDHCKIVVFDRATRTVKWQHGLTTPEGGRSFPMEIKKSGNSLYVHDNQFNLHVFKIEN